MLANRSLWKSFHNQLVMPYSARYDSVELIVALIIHRYEIRKTQPIMINQMESVLQLPDIPDTDLFT